MNGIAACLALLLAVGVAADNSPAAEPGLREDFASLDAWEPLTFPKIPRHSTYRTVMIGNETAVEASADDSASGLVSRQTVRIAKTPILHFRWRIEKTWEKGDATRKDGDDYPIRVYIVFAYDPAKASFGQRISYAAAKVRLGEYPPDSSISYIWANRPHDKRILDSPYTDRAKMIPLDAGQEHAGTWREHTVNILDDYKAAFGTAPPAEARIAIMIDTDNTHDAGKAWIDFLQLLPAKN